MTTTPTATLTATEPIDLEAQRRARLRISHAFVLEIPTGPNPAPRRYRVEKDGAPWKATVTGWHLECTHLAAHGLRLVLTGTTPVPGVRAQDASFALSLRVTNLVTGMADPSGHPVLRIEAVAEYDPEEEASEEHPAP